MMGRIPSDVRGGLLELFYGARRPLLPCCAPPWAARGSPCSGATGAFGARQQSAGRIQLAPSVRSGTISY